MNKKLTILVSVLTLLFVISCSKQSNVDDLARSENLDSLLARGQDSLKTNPRISLLILKEVMAETNDSSLYYKANSIRGTGYLLLGDLDSALLINEQVLRYLSSNKELNGGKELQSTAYNLKGNVYSRVGNTDSALVYYKKALLYNVNKKQELNILINIADQYKLNGNYAQASSVLRRALFVSDSLHLVEFRFPINFALGGLYHNLKDYSKADYYYLIAEKDYEKRSLSEKALFCNFRGNYYYYIAEYSKAEEWFLREKQIVEKSKDKFSLYLTYLNLADVSLNLDKLDSCQIYADKANAYFTDLNMKTAIYYINAIRLGLAIKQHDYPRANQLQLEFKDVEEGVEPNITSIRNKYLEQLHASRGNYKNAYEYLKNNIKLDDSLRSDIIHKRIEELDIRYKQDTLVLSKEILIGKQRAEVEHLHFRTYLWIMVSISGLLLSILAYFIIQRKNNRQRLKYLEQVTKFKITNIQNRLSPHFLFNVLNNEIAEIDGQKRERLVVLSGLLRKSLNLVDEVSISLSDEIEFAKAYIELEKHKLGNNFELTWKIDSGATLENIRIIPLMIQIPVENAIKHGLAQLPRDKVLEVRVDKMQEGIRIYIVDNGRGFFSKGDFNTTQTGTGLRAIRQMIDVLNSYNKDKITFSIDNSDEDILKGAKVSIFIPNDYKFEY
ncbi:MAG: histidine kinase [Dysgonomonas sp.]